MSSKSSKGKGCHSAKCRRAFLHESIKNGNSKDVKSYFKLMGRLGAKDKRFTKYLQSDLKYFVQRGGNDPCNVIVEEKYCGPPHIPACIWLDDKCHSKKLIEIEAKKAKKALATTAALSKRMVNSYNKAKAEAEAELAELEAQIREEKIQKLMNSQRLTRKNAEHIINTENAALEAELEELKKLEAEL